MMRAENSTDNRADQIRYNPLTPKLALQLAAPHTWAASVFPSLFGILYCVYRSWDIGVIEAALLLTACVLMQAAVNTFNDYMDFVKGTDSVQDNLEKDDAVLLYAGVDPRKVRNLAFAFLGTAALIGIGFTVRRGPVPLLIGLVGGMIVLLYSGGPLPISYLPLARGDSRSYLLMEGCYDVVVVARPEEPLDSTVDRLHALFLDEGSDGKLFGQFFAERGRHVRHFVVGFYLLAEKPFLDLIGAVLLLVYIAKPSLELVSRERFYVARPFHGGVKIEKKQFFVKGKKAFQSL